ncbi:dCTP deaminase [Rhodococcus ruber]|uniref:dCTP deaminase n=1 Tax=Rhodococcus ruber TaxID=1830 RepID=UPI001EEDBE18|nr:dCTP deaminase [Rhodococcus ruber]MCF8785253.1 dCTP deaminase [Rhodococcus ruber]
MFLSSSEIQSAVDSSDIRVVPALVDNDIRPFGIRLHLGHEFLIPEPGQPIEVDGSGEQPNYRKVTLEDSGTFQIRPGEFALGTTLEQVGLSDSIAGFLDGRSTLARLGLFIHAGSQIIDGTSNSNRTITLEIYNAGRSSLILRPGCAIAMLSFFRSSIPSESKRIHGQYDGQLGVMGPRLGSF